MEPSPETLRLGLYLSYIRSMAVVGRALADRFPDEASWEAARSSPEFIQDLNCFSTTLADMKSTVLSTEFASEQDLEDAVINNYDLAVDSVAEFAEKYNIPLEDFVHVLMHG